MRKEVSMELLAAAYIILFFIALGFELRNRRK